MAQVDLGLGVFARIRSNPGQREQLLAALRPLIDSGAGEEGTTVYILHESTDDPDSIWFYARFNDQQALEVHQANEQALLAGLVEVATYLAEAPQVEYGSVLWDKDQARANRT